MKYVITLLLIFISWTVTTVSAQVVINEYSCSNLDLTFDNYSEYEDWIELYNPSNVQVNIGSYCLSDKVSQPTKWRFPANTMISANGFLKIWTSGRNEVTGNNYHTNFRLTQTKFPTEVIVFADPSGNIIDQTTIRLTKKSHSCGRNPDGGANWFIYTLPTEGSANAVASVKQRYANQPVFSSNAGFYTGTQTVSISTTETNCTIRYTLDGTEPDASSLLYTSPLTIDSTKVLKAVTISNNPSIAPSFINFSTYFIDDFPTLPVVSIAANDLVTLADGDSNLRPEGTIEYFNMNRVRKTAGYGSFNSHGQDSWANDQRSLDFIMRDEMGYNFALQEQLFNLTPREEFQRIILRAAGDDNYPAAHNSSNEGSAHVRDAFLQNLAKKGGLNLDVRTATKAIVYINGLYWGVYDIRENPDDHDYTEYYYGQGKYDLQYIETWGSTWAEYGGYQALDAWDSLYNYIMANNMSNQQNWNYVNSQLDVTSLVDYVIVNSLSVCSDWLNYNTGWWRGLNPLGGHKKWGYILWDNDAIYGFYINYTGIPEKGPNAAPCDVEGLTADPNGHIEILGKLRQNTSFNNYYISRYIDLTNTVFSCQNLLPTLDSIVAVIDPEMTRHAQRWYGTYNEWRTNVQLLRDYIVQRCAIFPSKLDSCYSLTGPYPLTVACSPIGSGKIKINSLTLGDFPWTGNYHNGVPVSLMALPDSLNGFIFDHWEIQNHTLLPSSLVRNPILNITTGDTAIAHFVQQPLSVSQNKPGELQVWAYPTLFSSETQVIINLQKEENMSLTLYSNLGQELLTIAKSKFKPGQNRFLLNLAGKNIKPGMYLLNLKSDNSNKTIRLVYTGE